MSKLLLALTAVTCLGATSVLAAQKSSSKAPAEGGAGAAPLLPASPIASIDGKPILYSEIEGSIGAHVRLAEAEYLNKAYELRRGALDQLVMTRLVEAEAKKAGKDVSHWIEEDILAKIPEPTEEELHKAYGENKDQLSGADFEQSKARLREHLRNVEGRKRFSAYVQELVAKHEVKVLLVPPELVRFAVQASGPSRGAEKAKVTIVEFSDFQCPYCSRIGSTLAQVLKEYDGKVRVVYRQFPLGFHPLARKAAEASLCANDQGKFWELHDRMFANQSKLSVSDLKAAAKDLGLDASKFEVCLDGGTKGAAVEADLRAGQEVGVQGTPSLFVNGVFINGAVPLEQLKATIDRELTRG
jgi:protein-disulfide isomerase